MLWKVMDGAQVFTVDSLLESWSNTRSPVSKSRGRAGHPKNASRTVSRERFPPGAATKPAVKKGKLYNMKYNKN